MRKKIYARDWLLFFMMKNLLVIDYGTANWYTISHNQFSHFRYEIFKGAKLSSGETIRVEQAAWKDIVLTSCSEKGAIVELQGSPDPVFYQQKNTRSMKVDFLLVRNFSAGLHGENFRNILYGFMFANVPSVNSLQSIYMCSEKPIVYGELKRIQDKLGKENFPLVCTCLY